MFFLTLFYSVLSSFLWSVLYNMSACTHAQVHVHPCTCTCICTWISTRFRGYMHTFPPMCWAAGCQENLARTPCWCQRTGRSMGPAVCHWSEPRGGGGDEGGGAPDRAAWRSGPAWTQQTETVVRETEEEGERRKCLKLHTIRHAVICTYTHTCTKHSPHTCTLYMYMYTYCSTYIYMYIVSTCTCTCCSLCTVPILLDVHVIVPKQHREPTNRIWKILHLVMLMCEVSALHVSKHTSHTFLV